MKNFKIFSPLNKIRIFCLLNIVISTLLVFIYVWIEASFQNKIEAIILAFIFMAMTLIPLLFVRIVFRKSGVNETQPSFLITEDARVYRNYPLFLIFLRFLLLLPIGVMLLQSYPLTDVKMDVIILAGISFAVAINIYLFIELSWIYRNVPHLNLPV